MSSAPQYGRLIQQNIDQAHYLAGLVEAAPELELALPVSLNVVCFRYVPKDPAWRLTRCGGRVALSKG